jgi:hypothetical protein
MSGAATVRAVIGPDGALVVPPEELGDLAPGTSVTVTIARPEVTVTTSEVDADRQSLAVIVGALLAAAVAVGVLAGHGRQWPWTGFKGNDSLWSWLTMLVQPVALVALTLRLLAGEKVEVLWRRLGLGVAAVLALVALGGYSFNWGWTGFGHEKLWDWLHLLLFPIVLTLLPEWLASGKNLERRHAMGGAVALAGFGLLVWGGYRWGWGWTGFTGNTFRDWLDLLIAPFLLPAACEAIHARQRTERAAGLTSPG